MSRLGRRCSGRTNGGPVHLPTGSSASLEGMELASASCIAPPVLEKPNAYLTPLTSTAIHITTSALLPPKLRLTFIHNLNFNRTRLPLERPPTALHPLFGFLSLSSAIPVVRETLFVRHLGSAGVRRFCARLSTSIAGSRSDDFSSWVAPWRVCHRLRG